MEVSAVARRLSLSVQTVYRLGESGEITMARLGKKCGYRILRSSVDAFEEKRLLEFECGSDGCFGENIG